MLSSLRPAHASRRLSVMSVAPAPRSRATPVVCLAALVGALLCAAACPPKKDPPPSEPAPAVAPTGDGAAPASSAPTTNAPPNAPPNNAPPNNAPTAAGAPSFTAPPPGERVLILYTASVQGYVEPCGCTADPLGGVARLQAAVAQARAAYGGRVLLLDAGDMLFEKADDNRAADQCQAEARVDLLLQSQARAGVRATVLGPLDDVRGAQFRDARMAKNKIVTLGVPDAGRALTSGAQLQSSLLDDATHVGVVGFRADDEARAKQVHDALAKEVAALQQKGARAIVALAQSPRGLTRRIVTGLPIDVVIQGRAPGEVPVAPERVGDNPAAGAIIVASGQQAQNLGAVELVLEGRQGSAPLALDDRAAAAERSKKLIEVRLNEMRLQVRDLPAGPKKDFLAQRVAQSEAELAALAAQQAPMTGPHVRAWAVPLARGLAEDAQAKAALVAYTQAIPQLVASCESKLTCAPAPEGAPTYVGAKACATCHAAAFAFWQQQTVRGPGKDKDGKAIERVMGHAHAWRTLTDDHKDTDRSCVGCHSTGFDLPGGPCKSSDITARGLENVQCEACHGPGSIHARTKLEEDMKDPEEQTCRGCHHVPHIETTESFVFADKLKLITGPGHGYPASKP
jgi:hypothetical protein